jgi:hypothetical protein
VRRDAAESQRRLSRRADESSSRSRRRRGGSASGALTSPPPVSRRIINAAPFVVLHIISQNENPAQGVEARQVSGTLMGPTILGEPSLSVRAPLDGNVRHQHNSRGPPRALIGCEPSQGEVLHKYRQSVESNGIPASKSRLARRNER